MDFEIENEIHTDVLVTSNNNHNIIKNNLILIFIFAN